MTIRILDPTQPPEVLPVQLAQRCRDVGPFQLALLSNGKTNADVLLRHVKDHVADQLQLRQVVEVTKSSSTTNAPETLLDELAKTCEIAIVAIGD